MIPVRLEPRPLGHESSTLPLSHCAPKIDIDKARSGMIYESTVHFLLNDLETLIQIFIFLKKKIKKATNDWVIKK